MAVGQWDSLSQKIKWRTPEADSGLCKCVYIHMCTHTHMWVQNERYSEVSRGAGRLRVSSKWLPVPSISSTWDWHTNLIPKNPRKRREGKKVPIIWAFCLNNVMPEVCVYLPPANSEAEAANGLAKSGHSDIWKVSPAMLIPSMGPELTFRSWAVSPAWGIPWCGPGWSVPWKDQAKPHWCCPQQVKLPVLLIPSPLFMHSAHAIKVLLHGKHGATCV